MNVGEMVRTLRTSAGLKQVELASRAGISASSLSLIEAGRRDPTLKWLRRIAPVLGLPASVLFAAVMAIDEAEHGDTRTRALAEQLIQTAKALLLGARLERKLNATHGSQKQRRTRRSAD